MARRWLVAAAGFLLGSVALSVYMVHAPRPAATEREVIASSAHAPANQMAASSSTAPALAGGAAEPGGELDQHAESSVLMAIVEDAPGHVRCVRWVGVNFGGRSLCELTPEELRAIGMGMLCAEDSPRALVVGMQGPRSALPSSDDHATALARCLLKTASCGVGTFDSTRCAQAGCAGARVRMRVESLALR
jgi:hypothetical protein